MAYVINDSCVSCGSCAGECPVSAICFLLKYLIRRQLLSKNRHGNITLFFKQSTSQASILMFLRHSLNSLNQKIIFPVSLKNLLL